MWMNGSRSRRSTPAKARRTGNPSPSKPDGAVVTERVRRRTVPGAGTGTRARVVVSSTVTAGMPASSVECSTSADRNPRRPVVFPLLASSTLADRRRGGGRRVQESRPDSGVRPCRGCRRRMEPGRRRRRRPRLRASPAPLRLRGPLLRRPGQHERCRPRPASRPVCVGGPLAGASGAPCVTHRSLVDGEPAGPRALGAPARRRRPRWQAVRPRSSRVGGADRWSDGARVRARQPAGCRPRVADEARLASAWTARLAQRTRPGWPRTGGRRVSRGRVDAVTPADGERPARCRPGA